MTLHWWVCQQADLLNIDETPRLWFLLTFIWWRIYPLPHVLFYHVELNFMQYRTQPCYHNITSWVFSTDNLDQSTIALTIVTHGLQLPFPDILLQRLNEKWYFVSYSPCDKIPTNKRKISLCRSYVSYIFSPIIINIYILRPSKNHHSLWT